MAFATHHPRSPIVLTISRLTILTPLKKRGELWAEVTLHHGAGCPLSHELCKSMKTNLLSGKPDTFGKHKERGKSFQHMDRTKSAAAALLVAPASGARTRRRLVHKGEEVADYSLHEHSKQLLDEAETILRRAKGAATRR